MIGPYGVIGDPIAHSLSPFIHTKWLKEYNIDTEYKAHRVSADDLDSALAEFERRGFGGLNVTLPHKLGVLAASHTQSEAAKRIGAANTLIWKEKGWHAENTDAPGFLKTLEDTHESIAGKTVGVIGAGGAAKAIVEALSSAGAATRIYNRTYSRAKALADSFVNTTAIDASLDNISQYTDEVDLLVNTASYGYEGKTLDLGLGKDRLFYDISYGNAAAAGLHAAAETGWRTLDGLGMLVAQAAFSFQHWFDIMPETQTMLKTCRAHLESDA